MLYFRTSYNFLKLSNDRSDDTPLSPRAYIIIYCTILLYFIVKGEIHDVFHNIQLIMYIIYLFIIRRA